jgi:hypothetical protein
MNREIAVGLRVALLYPLAVVKRNRRVARPAVQAEVSLNAGRNGDGLEEYADGAHLVRC